MKLLEVVLVSILFCSLVALAREPISSGRLEKLSGMKANRDAKQAWDKRYNTNVFVYGKAPAKFLADNYKVFPEGASILDMGMGEGRHAVFLADKGYRVTGIDISSVAVKKANAFAKDRGVKIKTIVADMSNYRIKNESFDGIICFYYVDRSLNERIFKWLKPGGLLVYEANTTRQKEVPGTKKEDWSYFLKEQEILTMFKGMKVVKYEEPEDEKNFRASVILKKLEK